MFFYLIRKKHGWWNNIGRNLHVSETNTHTIKARSESAMSPPYGRVRRHVLLLLSDRVNNNNPKTHHQALRHPILFSTVQQTTAAAAMVMRYVIHLIALPGRHTMCIYVNMYTYSDRGVNKPQKRGRFRLEFWSKGTFKLCFFSNRICTHADRRICSNKSYTEIFKRNSSLNTQTHSVELCSSISIHSGTGV